VDESEFDLRAAFDLRAVDGFGLFDESTSLARQTSSLTYNSISASGSASSFFTNATVGNGFSNFEVIFDLSSATEPQIAILFTAMLALRVSKRRRTP